MRREKGAFPLFTRFVAAFEKWKRQIGAKRDRSAVYFMKIESRRRVASLFC